MEFSNIVYEKREAVAKVTVNRSKVLNALNKKTFLELGKALEDAAMDDAVRIVIITGAGNRAFIVGVDVKEMKDYCPPEASSFLRLAKERVLDVIRNMEKPVIAAVNGFALGGGCEVAMTCDLIIAVETARFGQPEIKLGLTPGLGGMTQLPRIVGMKKAKELVFTGDMIDAREAERLGLVNQVVPVGKLDEAVSRLVDKILSKSAVAIKVAKDAMKYGANTSLDVGGAHEIEAFASLFSTEDAKEGIRAFLEKRKPVFKDR